MDLNPAFPGNHTLSLVSCIHPKHSTRSILRVVDENVGFIFCGATISYGKIHTCLFCLPGFPLSLGSHSSIKPLHACTFHLLFPVSPSALPASSFTCSCMLNLFHLRTRYDNGNKPHHCCWRSFAAFFDPPPPPTSSAHWLQNSERPCVIWCVLRRDKWNYSAVMQGF